MISASTVASSACRSALPRQPPIGRWRHLVLTQEGAVEVGDVEVADLEADVGDRHFGFGKQLAGLPDAQLVDVVGKGIAGVLLEEAGKRRLAHPGTLGEVGKVDVGGDVFVDEGECAAQHVERLRL